MRALDEDDGIGPILAIPGVNRSLDEELAQAIALPRGQATAAIKGLKREQWRRLGAWYIERINEVTGLDIAVQLTGVVDAIINTLIGRAMKVAKAPEDWFEQAGVFAIGGYGRAEFNPHSDLDIMLVVKDANPAPWIREANAELQTLLWDCGFQVGASMRSLAELEAIVSDDFVTATAILEKRPLQASAALDQAMTGILQRFQRRRLQPFLRYKVEETLARRETAGASIFAMEPNLKSHPGALRDIQFLRNLSFMLFGSRNLQSLRELDTIEQQDVADLFAANDHLLGLRSLLHFHHDHRQDQFLLADQMRCAELLGFDSKYRLRAVELLMRDHFRKTAMVDQIVALSIDRIRSLGYLGRRKSLLATRKPLCDGFVIIDGAVYLAERHYLNHPQWLQRVMTMAVEAQRRGVRLSIALQRRLHQQVTMQNVAAVVDHETVSLFMRLLSVDGRVSPIMRDLHGASVLGLILPEFALITCHMQFDAYHHYTVDEHTLIAMEHLDRIARCQSDVPQVLQQLYLNIRRHDILALAVLLHDVGKFMGRGHVARGALMVGPIARRLRLNEEEEDLLRFLVAEHVLLSNASQQRDIRDRQLLEELAQRVGTVGRLDILYCLTWADAKAVGPKVWTGWQESLLEECYLSVRAHMQDRDPAPESQRSAVLQELTGLGLGHDTAQAWLTAMPSDYPHQIFPPALVTWHFQLSQQASNGDTPFAAAAQKHEGYWTLLIVLPDRAHLLADVAAVCSGSGLDIQGARVWIRSDGQSVLSLRVTCSLPGRWNDQGPWDKLYAALAQLFSKRAEHAEWLRKRQQMIPPEPLADSTLDDVEIKCLATANDNSVLDVRVRDRPGLLAALCNGITDQGYSIEFAQVSTMGDQAVDVFYVSHNAQALTSEQATGLAQAIEALVLKDQE